LGKTEIEEGPVTDIPRGKYIGEAIDPPADEAEHFINAMYGANATEL
jgi:hypothetical protein